MTAKSKVTIGLALWLLATAHVATILVLPFTGTNLGGDAWKLLLGPLGITAINAFYGAHLATTHGRFWTRRRLIGLSLISVASAFGATASAMWSGTEHLLEDGTMSALLAITVLIMGPLGFSGLVLLIRGNTQTQGEKHAKSTE